MTPQLSDALRRAFIASSYCARLPTGAWLHLRIGEASPWLDARLARQGRERWSFLHAVNPGSLQLDDEENARRHRELAAALRADAAEWHEGFSRADAGDWPDEPGYLVLDLELSVAVALARRFGQLAIVAGVRGSPAELHAC